MTSSDIFASNPPGTAEKLASKTIGIAGCGGLGSNAAAALTRAGIGRLILADFDAVETSNLNRQLYFQRDVGRFKVEALSEHLKAINPSLVLETHCVELTPENLAQYFSSADLLIEAFDKAENKKWLIESWSKLHPSKPIVCGNGLSGYGRTNDLRLTSTGNIHFCGDGETDRSMGLISSRVAIVANMQANIAIELLMGGP